MCLAHYALCVCNGKLKPHIDGGQVSEIAMGNFKASWRVRPSDEHFFWSREFVAQKLILFIHISCLVHRKAQHTNITLRHLRSTCKRDDCSRQSFLSSHNETSYLARARIIELLTHYGFHVWIFYGVQIPHAWAPTRDCFRTLYMIRMQRTPTMDRTMNVN